MPAKTAKQRKFMGVQLSKKRSGKKTDVNMTEEQLEHYASKPKKKAKQSKESY